MLGIEHPEYLPHLIGVFAVLLLALPFYVMRRKKALRGYPSISALTNSAAVENLRSGAVYIALAAAMAILLGYRYERETMVPDLEGLEIAAMVDCSQSMLAPVGGGDFTPRLTVVTNALDDALRALKKDRWGLGCFSTVLNGVSAMTNDYEHLLRPKLEVMQDPRYIGIVGAGTNFGAGIEGCFKLFNFAKKAKKVCIILSDGEPQGNEAKLRSALADSVAKMKSEMSQRKLDVAFYLVGVGSPEEEFKIPVYDYMGNPKGFAADKEGNPYHTRPDPEYLQKIADQFQGEYIHLKPGEKLSRLLEDIMNSERRKVGEKVELARTDVSTPLIVFIICCLFLFLKCPKRVSDLWKWFRR